MLAKEFGWTLKDMRELYPSELVAIVNELKKQKEVWEYAEFRGKWAFLASVITNAAAAIVGMFSKRKPKQVNPDDFLDKKWRKKVESMFKEAQPSPTKDEWASLIDEAKMKGLKGPWELFIR